MGLVVDILKTGAAVALFVAKGVVGVAADMVGEAVNDTKKAQDVRRNARGMSDRDLISGAKDTRNFWSTRMGLAQQYKDRHLK